MVEFDCGHHRECSRKRNPKPGDDIWCLRCHREVKMVRLVEEYRARCFTCRYSRPFGLAKIQAEIKAARHHNRNPSHEVKVLYGTEVSRVFPAQVEKLFTKALPDSKIQDVDLPPF